MKPRLSIITPLYNGEKYLGETVQSVLDQSFTDWEMLLVDDGSSDGSLALAKELASRDARVRVFSQANAGVAATRHRAAMELSSDSDFLMFLDQDDVLRPSALSNLVQAADDHPNCVAVHGFLEIIDGNSQVQPGHPCEDHNWRRERGVDGRVVPTPINELTTFETLSYLLFIYTPGSVLIRRSAFLKTGGLDQSVAPADDWDLYLKLALLGPFYPLPQTVIAWRLHGENNTFNRAKIMSTTDAVCERYLASVENPLLRKGLEDGYLQFTRTRLKDADESEEIQRMLRERETSLSAKIAARLSAPRLRVLAVLPSTAESCALRDTLDLFGSLLDRIDFRFIAMDGGDCESEIRALGDCRNVESLVKSGRSIKDQLTAIPRKLSWEKWIAEFDPQMIYLQSAAAIPIFDALKIPLRPAMVRELGAEVPNTSPEKHASRLEIVDTSSVPVGASAALTIAAARALDKDHVQSVEPYVATPPMVCPQELLEAMLKERPIVYAANDAQIGFIVGPAGVAVTLDLISAARDLLANKDQRNELGMIAKQRVYDNFSIETSAEKLYARMQRVIA